MLKLSLISGFNAGVFSLANNYNHRGGGGGAPYLHEHPGMIYQRQQGFRQQMTKSSIGEIQEIPSTPTTTDNSSSSASQIKSLSIDSLSHQQHVNSAAAAAAAQQQRSQQQLQQAKSSGQLYRKFRNGRISAR